MGYAVSQNVVERLVGDEMAQNHEPRAAVLPAEVWDARCPGRLLMEVRVVLPTLPCAQTPAETGADEVDFSILIAWLLY